MHKRIAGICVFFVSLFFYLHTLCPSVYVGDSGELIAATYSLGIAHPPGYPLFCFLAKIITLIFSFGAFAFQVNFATSVFAALTVMVLYFFIFEIAKRYGSENTKEYLLIIISVTGSLCFAFSKTFWSQCTMAEVYTLTSLSVIATLFLLTSYGRIVENGDINRAKKILYIFSLVYGIAFANHNTLMYLFPFYTGYIIYTGKGKLKFDVFIIAIALMFLGLTFYMYMPLRSLANPAMDWGNPETLDNFIRQILRTQYGRLAKVPRSIPRLFEQSFVFLKSLLYQFTPYLLSLSILGLILNFKRKIVMFTVLIFVAFSFGIIFLMNFNITPKELDSVEVFYIPAYLITTIWMSLGVLAICQIILLKNTVILGLLCLVLPVAPLLSNYFAEDNSR